MSDKKMDKALMAEMGIDKNELKSLKKKLLKAEGISERGIETWFRLASRNLYTRRKIVDAKANILLTVNSIILSFMLGGIYPLLSTDRHLVYAIVPMILTNVGSAAFAILATRPKWKQDKPLATDGATLDADLMSFEDFSELSEEAYGAAVEPIMTDRNFLYDTIKKDIHRLGVDLNTRYRSIRISYDIFLYGLIISVLMFAGCHAFFS
jgi:hypothetical protein